MRGKASFTPALPEIQSERRNNAWHFAWHGRTINQQPRANSKKAFHENSLSQPMFSDHKTLLDSNILVTPRESLSYRGMPKPSPEHFQFLMFMFKDWRRGSESNRRMRLLQSPALPLGYPATQQRAHNKAHPVFRSKPSLSPYCVTRTSMTRSPAISRRESPEINCR